MSPRSRPHRLDPRVEDPRFLTRDDCVDLFTRLRKFTSALGTTTAAVTSQWLGSVRWARNDTTVASDTRETGLQMFRHAALGSDVGMRMNQIDDVSLRAAVTWAERLWYLNGGTPYNRKEEMDPWIPPVYLDTPIWSETTYQQTPEARNAVASSLVASAKKAGMMSAGYLAVEGWGTSLTLPGAEVLYARQTFAQCSLTVRDPEGSGSGWAGGSSYDWARFDPQKLAEIALDKCLRSRNPVAIEPGRYTTILEPQATFQLMSIIMGSLGFIGNTLKENAEHFYDRHENILVDPNRSKAYGRNEGLVPVGFTKLGQKVFDERVTLQQKPTDLDTGIRPFNDQGEAYRPQTWVENGVLKKLEYTDKEAHQWFHESEGANRGAAFVMGGGPTSVEEMIKTTTRGLLVTHFWDVRWVLGTYPNLYTGVTRDGLWLIERGAITKAVKNMRFTESPMFVFNQVEALGMAVPIFSPHEPAVVPPVKIKDFSFTSLVDAV